MALLLSRTIGRQFFVSNIVRRNAVLAPVRAVEKEAEDAKAGKSTVVGKAILAKRLAQEHNLTAKKATEILDDLLDDIMLSVAEGSTVTIPGFGSFKKRHRAARKGRNPKTGVEIDIAATDSPAFTAGTVFKGVVKTGSWDAFEEAAAAQKAAAAEKKQE